MSTTTTILFLLSLMATMVSGFVPVTTTTTSRNSLQNNFHLYHKKSVVVPAAFGLSMITIAEGVEFDTIAREWRCKWNPEGDKASLVAAQQALLSVADDLKQIPGVKSVERIVCGGCLDFKVITSLQADQFAAWEQKEFAPEAAFLEMLQDIDGITVIETQTYTKMPV